MKFLAVMFGFKEEAFYYIGRLQRQGHGQRERGRETGKETEKYEDKKRDSQRERERERGRKQTKGRKLTFEGAREASLKYAQANRVEVASRSGPTKLYTTQPLAVDTAPKPQTKNVHDASTPVRRKH